MNVVVQKPLSESEAVSSSIEQAKEAATRFRPSRNQSLRYCSSIEYANYQFCEWIKSNSDVNKPILRSRLTALMNHLPNVKLLIKGYTDAHWECRF